MKKTTGLYPPLAVDGHGACVVPNAGAVRGSPGCLKPPSETVRPHRTVRDWSWPARGWAAKAGVVIPDMIEGDARDRPK